MCSVYAAPVAVLNFLAVHLGFVRPVIILMLLGGHLLYNHQFFYTKRF